MSDPVKAILDRRYPSYGEPLRTARKWNRGADKTELPLAERLLLGLCERYPTALHVWSELAFNLVRQGRRDDALAKLAEIDKRFGGRLDEDAYSLWGRCLKDDGHHLLDAGLAHAPGTPARLAALEEADHLYEQAAGRYRKGYDLAGNPFPGVNVAFLLFVRAGLARARGLPEESDRLAAQARQTAEELLRAASGWAKRQPDDHIWHLATRGEAEALLGRWDAAVTHYREAAGKPDRQLYHPESMGRQLRRVAQAHDLLGQSVPADLPARLPALAPFLSPDGDS